MRFIQSGVGVLLVMHEEGIFYDDEMQDDIKDCYKGGYMGLQVDWEGGHGVLYREPGWIHEVVGHQVKLSQSTYIVFVFVIVFLSLSVSLILRVGDGLLVI